jgi:hypothetical protein
LNNQELQADRNPKFNLHLEPTADIETVPKTIKRVGEELLDDPEISGEFMQPLKMQGVVDVLQTALVVRCKFTATPLRPTYLQRQAPSSTHRCSARIASCSGYESAGLDKPGLQPPQLGADAAHNPGPTGHVPVKASRCGRT